MGMSSRQRMDRTNVADKTPTTMNSPGTFYPKYGKTLIKVGGRGASGTSPTPGNYAGTNPTTGGNYAGENAGTGGNLAGYNPPTPGTTYTNPGSTTPGNYVPASTNPGTYTPGNTNQDSYNITYGTFNSCPANYSPTGEYEDLGNGTVRTCGRYTPGNTNPGSYTPGNTVPAYTNPGSYTPGNTEQYSSIPGNANYNPYYPGNAYYNPTSGGNAYYNPASPGSVGSPSVIAGVSFPGGSVGALAPVVAPTPTSWTYASSGYPVTVPFGGYVTFTPT